MTNEIEGEIAGDLLSRFAVLRQLTLELAAFLCGRMDAPAEQASTLMDDLRAAFPIGEARAMADERFVHRARAEIDLIERTLHGMLGGADH